MLKYSKFTDKTGPGRFNNTFCQNTDKFQKSVFVCVCVYVCGGDVTPSHTPALNTPLGIISETTHVCVLCAKFQVSGIILTTFSQVGGYIQHQKKLLNSRIRLSLMKFVITVEMDKG